MPRAYYNEIDKHCAEWLYNLQREDMIAPGDIDTRPIQDVRPVDLRGYAQHHFFAGIGGWSLALRRAGWSDHRPIWTGSCPCQPFSNAGKRAGFADARHLWPYWHWLIRQCSPATVLGEQVAGAVEWLRLVRCHLEALDYAVGAIPVEAASAGADHLRDRFWFVAHDAGTREGRWRVQQPGESVASPCERSPDQFAGSGFDSAVGQTDRDGARLQERERDGHVQREALGASPGEAVIGDGLANSDFAERWQRDEQRSRQFPQYERDPQTCNSGDMGIADREGWPAGEQASASPRHGDTAFTASSCDMGASSGAAREWNAGSFFGTQAQSGSQRQSDGHMSDGSSAAGPPLYEWVSGADGKIRRVKPGVRLLAHGISGRMAVERPVKQGQSTIQETHWYNRIAALKDFGNAIDPRPAAAFIRAVMDSIDSS